jgi:hypothetical protein
MKRLIQILFFMLMSFGALAQTSWHVTVNGTSSGSGSISSPWDLITGLSNSSILPGDTVFIHGGVYLGAFENTLAGNSSSRITIKPYNGEVAIFDGKGLMDESSMEDNGAYCDFYDFVFTNSSGINVSYSVGSHPYMPASSGIYATGADHVNYINLIFHDCTHDAMGLWSGSNGNIVSGCIFFNNGWWAPDRGHGFALYTQNLETSDYKQLNGNIMFRMHAYNMKAYSGSPGKVCNYIIKDNISFYPGVPANYMQGRCLFAGGLGGDDGIKNIEVRNNSVYLPDDQSAYALEVGFNGTNENCVVDSNVIHGGRAASLGVRGLSGTNEVKYNFIYGEHVLVNHWSVTGATVDWDNNTYYHERDPNQDYPWFTKDYEFMSDWNAATGHDANSSYYLDTYPTSNIVRIYKNEYEDKRAHISIYNYEGLSSVSVDVSDIFNVGDSLILYDAENLIGESALLKTVYSGGSISIPMNLTELAPHPAYKFPITHTEDDFGAYVVLSHSLNIPDIRKEWGNPEIAYSDPDEIYDIANIVYHSVAGTSVTVQTFDTTWVQLDSHIDIADVDGLNVDTVDFTNLPYENFFVVLSAGGNADTIKLAHVTPVFGSGGAHLIDGFFNHLQHNFEYTAADTIDVYVYTPTGELVNHVVQPVIKNILVYDNSFTIDLSNQTDYVGGVKYHIVKDNGYTTSDFVYLLDTLSAVRINRCAPAITTGYFTLAYATPTTGTATIEVLNSSSSTVYSTTDVAEKGTNIVNIDLSAQADGEYYSRVTLNGVTVQDTVTKSSSGIAQMVFNDSGTVPFRGAVTIDIAGNDDSSIALNYIRISKIVGGSAASDNKGKVYFVHDSTTTTGAGFWYTSEVGYHDITNSAYVSIAVTGAGNYIDITQCSPSPTTGSYTVYYSTDTVGSVGVAVRNSSSTLVYSTSVTSVDGNNTIPIDLSGEDDDTYTTTLTIGSLTDNCSIVKYVAPVIPTDSIIITSDTMLADSILNNRQPGDTLWLKANFTGNHDFTLSGTEGNYIVITSHRDHMANFNAYQFITGNYLKFEGVTFNYDTYVQGDDIEFDDVTIENEGLTISGEDDIIGNCVFNSCDTAMYLNGAVKPQLQHNVFTDTGKNIYQILFPATDWRGYYYNIDNNTYNIAPSTKFNGMSWGSWRPTFPDYDNNSTFNVTQP